MRITKNESVIRYPDNLLSIFDLVVPHIGRFDLFYDWYGLSGGDVGFNLDNSSSATLNVFCIFNFFCFGCRHLFLTY